MSEKSEANEARRREQSIITLEKFGQLQRSQRITRDEMWRRLG